MKKPKIPFFHLSAQAKFHRSVQCLFFLFYCYVGLAFIRYAAWVMGNSLHYVEKPPSVEAFLPIAGFMAAKRWFLTGYFDPIHPAGLTIFLLAIVVSFFFRKAFCGWLCPIGYVSGLLGRLGKRLGVQIRVGKKVSFLLSLPKYLLLGAFVYLIGAMSIFDLTTFMGLPYYVAIDTKMLLLFAEPSTTLLVVLGVLVLGSMLIPSFWCRGFCPYGALLGVVSVFSPLAVARKAEQCIMCKKCLDVCPSRIPVYEKKRISGPECVGCTECIGICPQKNCLSLTIGYGKSCRAMAFQIIGIGTLLCVLFFYSWAVTTGHWYSKLPLEQVKVVHKMILEIGHP